tara:strand:- start:4499 stop:4666 length:168 start_codon:yes stop_codon:yes gene_type:complete
MIVLVVNENRYLFNNEVCDKAQDECAERILSAYPDNAIVDFDDVQPQDLINNKPF